MIVTQVIRNFPPLIFSLIVKSMSFITYLSTCAITFNSYKIKHTVFMTVSATGVSGYHCSMETKACTQKSGIYYEKKCATRRVDGTCITAHIEFNCMESIYQY